MPDLSDQDDSDFGYEYYDEDDNNTIEYNTTSNDATIEVQISPRSPLLNKHPTRRIKTLSIDQ